MKKNRKTYLITSLIVLVVIALIMILKKVYPFGSNFIGSGKYDEVYVPLLYRLSDIIHGKESFLYDFKVGGGTNIYNSLILYGMINPIMWLVALVPKSYIGYFGSFIVIFKLLLIALSSLYMIRKLFKNIKEHYQIFGSLIYTFSGFILLNISRLNYLDIAYLLPLVIVGINKMFEEKNNKLLVVSLLLCIAFNYALAFKIIILLIPFSFLYSILFKKKNKIVSSTLYALLFGAVFYIPSILDGGLGISLEISKLSFKIIYLFPLAGLIFLFVKQLLVKDKHSIFYGITGIVMLITMIFKPVMIGSIVSNYDLGVAITIVLLLGSMHYLDNEKSINSSKDSFGIGVFIFISLIVLYVAYTFRNVVIDSNLSYSIDSSKQLVALIIMFIISILLNAIAFKNKERKGLLINIGTILIVLVFSFYYITTDERSSINNIKDLNLSFKDDYRVKDNTLSLGSNYSLLLNVPSISYFDNSNIDTYEKLGYVKEGKSIYAGGTILTDLLLGNKYIYSYQSLPSSLYEKIDDNVYEMKYNFKFVIPYNEHNRMTSNNVLELQNAIYKEIFGNDNIIDVIKPDLKLSDIKVDNTLYYATSEDGKIRFTVNVGELSEVYLNMEANYGYVYSVKVNGERIKNPIFANRHNSQYPIADQKLLYLGEYDNTTLEVEMHTEYIDISRLEIGLIKTNSIINLVKSLNEDISFKYEKNGLKINYNDAKYERLFIPINYNKNLVITNNDVDINYYQTFDNFVSVVLENNNEIIIKYNYTNLLIGLFISLGSLTLVSGVKSLLKRYNKR